MTHKYFRIVQSVVATAAILWPSVSYAVSTWNPTLLVNTESFQEIDTGDGTTDVELRFGGTTNRLFYNISQGRFQFTKSLFVNGSITTSGALTVRGLMSGSSLNVTNNAGIRGNLSASGTLKIDGTTTLNGAATINAATTINAAAVINGDTRVRGNLSGSTLRIDGNAGFWGSLTASGTIATKSNLTINSDSDSNDAVLTFGNTTGNQSISFINTTQNFDFSKGIKALGNIRAVGTLSGTALNVDGSSVKVNGVQYNFGASQGGANTFLKNDGSGNLSWTATAVGNGSGSTAIHPEYPNAVYTASGSATVGTLTFNYDSTNKENYYRWTSSKGALQDYWIATRIRLPKNFTTWNAVPMNFRYRTNTTGAAANAMTVRLLDTTGANVALGSNAALVSGVANTWATANITLTGGTFTPDGTITILIKAASTSAGFADVGSINFNWTQTTP